MTTTLHGRRGNERGAAIVEFAFVSIVLIALVLHILQFAFILHAFNSAAQATRQGARTAAVSALNASSIVQDMKPFLLNLEDDNVVVCYGPNINAPEYIIVRLARQEEDLKVSGCNRCSCKSGSGGDDTEPYRVIPWFIPRFFLPVDQIAVPPFATALPRESLGAS